MRNSEGAPPTIPPAFTPRRPGRLPCGLLYARHNSAQATGGATAGRGYMRISWPIEAHSGPFDGLAGASSGLLHGLCAALGQWLVK